MSLTEQYLEYLARMRNLSPNTIIGYRRTYRTFPGIDTATREQVEAWWETRAHLSAGTRRVDLAAVRSFYTWCRAWDHRTDDPTLRISPPKQGHRLPRPISRADLLRLLDHTEGPIRRAICLGAYAGLRVAEAASLDWTDVDAETHRILVRGKGDKDRYVGLPTLLLDNLLPNTGGNVVRAGGSAWSANLLQQKINAAIHAAGVDATYHKLRHRYATVGLAATGNLLAVSRALGHSSPATTAIYAATSDSDLDVIADAVTR